MTKRSTNNDPARVVLVTGLSGSGKSIALNVLEDAGFYCIDNLPVSLFEALVRDITVQPTQARALTAIGIGDQRVASRLRLRCAACASGGRP